MRRYGGNFVSKLAEAMVAADPNNFRILVEAFPQIVEKYAEDQAAPSKEDVIRRRVDYIQQDLAQRAAQIEIAEAHYEDLVREAKPLEQELGKLRSKLYIICNKITKDKIHFSAADQNDGIWFNTVHDFKNYLGKIPEAKRKPFVEWNGRILVANELLEHGMRPTPGHTADLED